MKIKVTSSIFDDEFGKGIISPETIKKMLMSESEIQKIVSVLEESSIFTEAVIGLRKKYKVPERFYDYKGWKKFNRNNRQKSTDLFLEIQDLTRKLEIPSYFSLSISFFIFCNLFLIPERIPIQIHYIDNSIDNKEYIKSWVSNSVEDGSVFIEIKEQVSKEKLHNLIDEKWDDIESGMKLNLFKRPQNRMMRTELAKRIAELRDIQKLPFGKIANTLQKENPNVELYDILNEDYVKILYYRWKKKTNPQKVTIKE